MSDIKLDPATRQQLVDNPYLILDDVDLMRALVTENDARLGGNIVDMRGLAMERLEAQLDRLEHTHRAVVANAYSNISSTQQIQRAALCLVQAKRFEDLLDVLANEVTQILRLDGIRLGIESSDGGDDPSIVAMEKILCVMPLGSIGSYTGTKKPVLLRQTDPIDGATFFADHGRDMRSEACFNLTIGEENKPAILVMGSKDPSTFAPDHATDLLEFLGGTFEACLQRWLG